MPSCIPRYALAKYRQFSGVDKCTAAVPMAPSLTQEKLQEDSDNCTCMCFFTAVVSLLCAAAATCVLCFTKDIVFEVFNCIAHKFGRFGKDTCNGYTFVPQHFALAHLWRCSFLRI